MRLISEAIPAVAGRAFSRKYIMLGRIVTRWQDIVGEDMAAKAQPVRLNYIRNKVRDKKASFTLDVAVNNADATVLRYRVDLMLERINQIFGEGWIKAIRFVPGGAANEAHSISRKRRKPLTEAEKSYLSNILEDTDDPELQEKLKSLGESILLDSEENTDREKT